MIRILLVGHGQSEGNVNTKAYTEKGDHKVELTPTGWKQAIHAGKFLGTFYRDKGVTTWPRVFVSSYERPKQTLAGAMHGIGNALPGTPRIREDARLIEKHYGAENVLEYCPKNDAERKFANHLQTIFERTRALDPYNTPRLFGESSKDTMVCVKSFIDARCGMISNEGDHDIILFVHGAVMKDFLMSWAHLPMNSRDDMHNPGNCDVVEIFGEPKNWTIQKIYDGEKMVNICENILENIKPFSVQDLPTIPEEFRIDLE